MPLIEEAHKAARILLDHAYVRIVARSTPDAVCATALLAHALRRENIDFHVSWTPRLDAPVAALFAEERPDCLVLIGLSGDAHTNEPVATRRIALDDGAATFAADASVHDDASLAALAHLVAAGISRRNLDLAPLALAGAIASLRHVGGLRGLDAEILQESLEARLTLRATALSLHGATLVGALAQLDAPFIEGLTGRARNAKKLAADLGLAGEAPPSALEPEQAEALGSFLATRLLQQNAPDAAFDALFRPTLRALQGPHTGMESGELARLVEATCVAGRSGLGFAALWPDPGAGSEALDVLSSAREEIVAALLRAERDAKREGALLVADAPRAALCGPLADRLALASAAPQTIVVVHAPEGEESFLALRSFGTDVGALARAMGGAGSARAAHLRAPDATRARKALAERAAEREAERPA